MVKNCQISTWLRFKTRLWVEMFATLRNRIESQRQVQWVWVRKRKIFFKAPALVHVNDLERSTQLTKVALDAGMTLTPKRKATYFCPRE